MRLYLVRHAEANPKSEDPERHLSAKGRDQARTMADVLRPLDLHVAAVWHSAKTRAMETAAFLAGAVTADDGCVERDDLAPKDPVDTARRAIQRADADLMVVGHLPYLENLASKLLADNEGTVGVHFPAAGVLCLEHDGQEGWRIAWMVTPEVAGGMTALH